MVGNHGFADGNKRTTLLLVHTLIRKSGYQLVPLADEEISAAAEGMILDAATNQMDFDDLVEWFAKRIRRT